MSATTATEQSQVAIVAASTAPASALIVTICTILATLMQSLDSTIANVALPYMQGTMSASQEEINWVLTSYIVAAAIMTAPTGFLAVALRPHAIVRDRRRRLHHRLRAVRPGGIARPDRPVPHPAGRVRRRAGAAVAIGDVRTLPAGAARQGDGPVDHGRDDGPDLRPDPRRLADRQLQLALGLLHQRPVRHRHRDRPADLPEGEPAQRQRQARLDRLRRAQPGDRLVPDDARPRRDAGLVQLARDHHRGLHRRHRILRLPGAVLPGATAVPVAEIVRRPEFYRRRLPLRDHGPDHVRVAGAAGALSADADELPRRDSPASRWHRAARA